VRDVPPFPHAELAPPGTCPGAPLLPLRNFSHALGGEPGGGEVEAPRFTTHPVALGDVLAGGLAFTGAGRGGGVEAHAVDARRGGGGALPLVAIPAKRSGADSLRSVSKGTKSVINNIAAGVAGGTASGDVAGEVPPWAGAAPSLSVAAAASLPGSRPEHSATVLALDGDTLAVGGSDGATAVWRVQGVDTLSSLIAPPALRSRPDALLPGPARGPVLCLAVGRDEDTLVAGFPGEAWVYELTRGRPIARLPLEGFAPRLAGDAAKLLGGSAAAVAGGGGGGGGDGEWRGWDAPAVSAPAAVAAAVTAEGGVALAVASFVMVRAAGLERAGAGDAAHPLAVTHPGPAVSLLLLYGADSAAAPLPAPTATLPVPALVTCLARLRGGGTGDVEGPGALLAVGRADGVLTLHDARDLRELARWDMPDRAAVRAVDVAPCTSYLVAGGANGTLAAFALPAFSVGLPPDVAEYGGAVASERDAAHAAHGGQQQAQVAQQQSSGGIFGGLFGKKK
jgi:hypothetical protein